MCHNPNSALVVTGPRIEWRVGPAGSGDTAGFTGGSGSLTVGPDAFKGSDPCPWGLDTCLWDTRTAAVTNSVSPGDTSVTASVTSEDLGDGIDCINHIAQVFSTGPKSAASSEGYVTAGVGLRNQGSGNITLTGIPAGAQVVQARRKKVLCSFIRLRTMVSCSYI